MTRYEFNTLLKYKKGLDLTGIEKDIVDKYYSICRGNLTVELSRYIVGSDEFGLIGKIHRFFYLYFSYLE